MRVVEARSLHISSVDDLPAWRAFPLHPVLLHSIHRRGFTQPTPIQQQTLEVYLTGRSIDVDQQREELSEEKEITELKRRDIVGIAQTVVVFI